jgi:hypothetical protein
VNSVGRNFCASRISLLEQLVGDAAELLRRVHLCAAREQPSGIFTTSGRPSSSMARGMSPASASITVGGVATWFEPRSSIRNTLVHRIMEIGSSITGTLLQGAARSGRCVVDRGGLADEQAVVLASSPAPLGDRLDVDRASRRCAPCA